MQEEGQEAVQQRRQQIYSAPGEGIEGKQMGLSSQDTRQEIYQKGCLKKKA